MKSKWNLFLLLVFIVTLLATAGSFAYTWVMDPGSLKFPMQELRQKGGDAIGKAQLNIPYLTK